MERNELYFFSPDEVKRGDFIFFITYCMDTLRVDSNQLAYTTNSEGWIWVAVFDTVTVHAKLTALCSKLETKASENTSS